MRSPNRKLSVEPDAVGFRFRQCAISSASAGGGFAHPDANSGTSTQQPLQMLFTFASTFAFSALMTDRLDLLLGFATSINPPRFSRPSVGHAGCVYLPTGI